MNSDNSLLTVETAMIIEVLGHGKAKAKLFESFGMPYGAKNLLSSLLLCHFSSLKVFLLSPCS
ncbi:hypothetical protein NC651_002801 [Populus alba x Populus x berolinensis]|nr:hypothetical protein NC651_002801 [Populus alba x Populus x berolinensis]